MGLHFAVFVFYVHANDDETTMVAYASFIRVVSASGLGKTSVPSHSNHLVMLQPYRSAIAFEQFNII